MLTLLKKRISEDRISNVYVNSVLKLVDDGFTEIAALINEAPEFEKNPCVSAIESDKFLMIVIAGNMQLLPGHFNHFQEMRLNDLITRKFSNALGLDLDIFRTALNHHYSYFSRINRPSKNTLYAMSKAVFYKYNLVQYQDEYFRKMESPNPIFLKRLNEAMQNFIWDWEQITEKYKIVQ